MPISATITQREILVVRNSTRDRNCSISQLYRLLRRPAIKDISGRSSSRLEIQKLLSGKPSRFAIFGSNSGFSRHWRYHYDTYHRDWGDWHGLDARSA